MEMFAIAFGISFLIVGLLMLFNDEIDGGKFFILIALLFQLLWFPQMFDEKTKRKTFITDSHNKYVFKQPVKITKTRKYKPLSIFNDETIYTIEFLTKEDF